MINKENKNRRFEEQTKKIYKYKKYRLLDNKYENNTYNSYDRLQKDKC